QTEINPAFLENVDQFLAFFPAGDSAGGREKLKQGEEGVFHWIITQGIEDSTVCAFAGKNNRHTTFWLRSLWRQSRLPLSSCNPRKRPTMRKARRSFFGLANNGCLHRKRN